ncbi:MAG: hypothetical protein HYZ42_03730 [Bacteroidetes bacterium]|nr:hypothetical protein [Bacteroidota bacterium]
MKRITTFLFLLILCRGAFSQCYTDTLIKKQLAKQPLWEKGHINAVDWWRQQPQPQLRYGSGTQGAMVVNPILYTIPVVVHIDTTDGSTNLTDQQVTNEIAVLNAAFNPQGINFCLVNKDPQGNAFSGINRFADASISNLIDNQLATLVPFGYFDPKHYLNIYIVSDISVTSGPIPAGYAYLPGMFVKEDAIVVKMDYWGDYTNCNCKFASDSRGNVLVHEAGHYLGLYHTFYQHCAGATASTCSIKGDLCCDTRPVDHPTYQCPVTSAPRTCATYHLNIDDDLHNYMTYNSDACLSNFTQDQKSIMWAVLNTSRNDLVNSGSSCGKVSPYFTALTSGGCDLDTIRLQAIQFNGIKYRWLINDSSGNQVYSTSIYVDSLKWKPTAYGLYSVTLQLIDTLNHDTF